MRSMVIFDIDGTLSDDTKRWAEHVPLEYGTGHSTEPVDWDAYHADMREDAPVRAVQEVLSTFLKLGYGIAFFTGRPEQYREATVEWLMEHAVDPLLYPNLLRMRPATAMDSNTEVKRRALKDIRKTRQVVMAFENDERTIAMYREEGVICLRVSL